MAPDRNSTNMNRAKHQQSVGRAHLAATSKGLRVMLLNSLPNSDVNWRNQPVGYDMLL